MEADTIHHLLLVAFNRSNRAMTSRTRTLGLKPGQPKVLEYVAQNEGCAQSDIARAYAMDRATVTGVLERMEAAGLITRTPRRDDRRALEVRLTDKGWDAAEHVALWGSEVDEMACAGMTAEEREELSRLLVRMIENLEDRGEQGTHE